MRIAEHAIEHKLKVFAGRALHAPKEARVDRAIGQDREHPEDRIQDAVRASGSFWKFHGVEFYPDDLVISVDGLEAKLSLHSWRVLCLMIDNIGRVVTLDELIMAVYQDTEEPDWGQSIIYNLIGVVRLALKRIGAPIQVRNLHACGWGVVVT